MNEQMIDLQHIADNPYQPRTTDDPEHIEKLARSIAADGLLQAPKARKLDHNGSVQLAFGHSRRRAFEWLQQNWTAQGLTDRYDGYSSMPVEIVKLDDEQMYRQAVTENVQRKDLNPIEVASSMKQYMEEFGASSKKAGELFNMNDATVRGLVRLLELPEDIQGRVASGEITQGAARKLLTIKNANVDQEEMESIIEDIVAGADPEDVIERSLRNNDKAVSMWESWRGKEPPRGGKGLWLLSTEPDKFPELPVLQDADAAKALDMEPNARNKRDVHRWLEALTKGTVKGPDGIREFPEGAVSDHLIEHGAPGADIDRLEHLINPPSCLECPFHAVVDKSHYCTFKPCHQRKRTAWVADEMKKVSKKLGIAIYAPGPDGKVFIPLCEHSYMDAYKTHEKLVKDKDPSLRVAPHKDEYSAHKFTNSNFVRVIMVGEKAQLVKEKEQAAKERAQEKDANRDNEWRLQGIRRDAADKFVSEYATSFFAAAFKEMTHIDAMCILCGAEAPKKGTKKADALATLRVRLAARVISHMNGYSWEIRQKGPLAVAKFLQKVATTWGLKLPADFLEVAQGYEPVAAETPKKKGKK